MIQSNFAAPRMYLSLTAMAMLISTAATVTTFEAPGAGNAPGQGTFAYSINTAGTIVGYYIDSDDNNHGFLRSASGVLLPLRQHTLLAVENCSIAR